MERRFGVLEGNVYNGPRNKPEDTVGIEPSPAVHARLSSFWDEITRSRDQTHTVAVVSHGGALSTCLLYTSDAADE